MRAVIRPAPTFHSAQPSLPSLCWSKVYTTSGRHTGSCPPSLLSPVSFYLPKMCWTSHLQSSPLSCLYLFKRFCHCFYRASRGSGDKHKIYSPGLTSPLYPPANPPPHSLGFDVVFPAASAHPPPPTSCSHQPTQFRGLLLPLACTFAASERDTDTHADALRILRTQVLIRGFSGRTVLFPATVPLHVLFPLWCSSTPTLPLGISSCDSYSSAG